MANAKRSELPPDLTPLPGGNLGDGPINADYARTALWLHQGNMTRAAEILGVSPGRLAAYVQRTPWLQEERAAARAMLIDKAEDNIWEQLTDSSDTARRDDAARFVLNTLGRLAGWVENKRGPDSSIRVQNADGSGISIRWGDEEAA